MSFISFVFIFCCCNLCNIVWGEFIQWYHEHQECVGLIHGSIECSNLTYVDYFEEQLRSPKSEYHKEVAIEVLNLYNNLKEYQKPAIYDVHMSSPLFEKLNYSDNKFILHPITFAIPESNLVHQVPSKIKSFGRVIPGVMSTYFDLYTENQYYEDMQKSLFILTYKKGGWDCLRHYEILAAGSLPLFPDIHLCPPNALKFHPKSLYSTLLKQPGLKLVGERKSVMIMEFSEMSFDLSQLDTQLYSATVMAMIQYSKNIFTTKAIAKYVIQTMYKSSKGVIKSQLPKKILYLSHQDHDMDKGDYMTDFLLHGLKELLGESRVLDFPRRDCLYKIPSLFNHTDYLNGRLKLYGQGFSFGFKLDLLSDSLSRNQKEIESNIRNHHYDLVILGSGHRDGWASRLYFWNIICEFYHPFEVGIVDGADYQLKKKIIEKYAPCAGHYFSREGYSLKHL